MSSEPPRAIEMSTQVASFLSTIVAEQPYPLLFATVSGAHSVRVSIARF